MNSEVLLQRIDPDQRAYRWYRITLCNDRNLFGQVQVMINRGRIGQKGESIERFFESEEEALRYFNLKIREKISRGYTRVEELRPLVEQGCRLCELAAHPENDDCFVFAFQHSVLFINWDQTYLGRSMLVFKKHLPDFFHLSSSEILASLGEIRKTERALHAAFQPSLMNYLFMGNRARHVHLHFVPRYESDPQFGNSPFLDTNRAAEPQISADRYRELASQLRSHILEIG